MNIRPYGRNILVKPAVKRHVIVAPDGMLCEHGEVIAVGTEVSDKIKVGDKIGFSIFGLEHLEVDDEKFVFLPEDSQFLLGFIEE